jgi:hypothetical protein
LVFAHRPPPPVTKSHAAMVAGWKPIRPPSHSLFHELNMRWFLNDTAVAFIRELRAEWPRVKDATHRIMSMNGYGVSNGPGGITIRPPPPPPKPRPPYRPDVTLVCVRNASGSNGTASTQANWTYDLWDKTNTTQLATYVPLDATRPNGKLIAAPDGTYAWATRTDQGWVLLGFFNCEPELTGTADCP